MPRLNQIVQLKYVQFIAWKLYLNAAVKEKTKIITIKFLH